MKISNHTYDVLKWVALCFLPGAAVCWLSVAEVWGLPYGPEIGATITAVDTFLGVMLGLSSTQYNKNINTEEE